jgi:hypothetical protein
VLETHVTPNEFRAPLACSRALRTSNKITTCKGARQW